MIQALLALVLLMTGGLDALQTCSIVAALPLTVIMLLCAVCLFKGLMEEKKIPDEKTTSSQLEKHS